MAGISKVVRPLQIKDHSRMCMGGGGRVYNRQCAAVKTTCEVKMQLYKKHLNLRGTTASSGMYHIANSCMLYTHVHSATRGCRCSLVGPRRAPDLPTNTCKRERLRETRTHKAKASLREIPGPIVSSSHTCTSVVVEQ